MCCYVDLRILQAVEAAIHLLIIPLNRNNLVEAVDRGQSVDDMGAKERINVVWGEFSATGSVLGPVGHVTHQLTG